MDISFGRILRAVFSSGWWLRIRYSLNKWLWFYLTLETQMIRVDHEPAGMLTIVCLRGPHMQTVKDTMALCRLTNLLSYHNGRANTLIRAHTVHKILPLSFKRRDCFSEQPLHIKTIWLPGFPKCWRCSLQRKHFRNPTWGSIFQ